jgi:predicted metallopeptidase
MNDTIKIKNKEYVKSQDLEVLADKVIHNMNMGIADVSIKYLLVYPHINKNTAGRCSRSNNLLKVYGNCDYVIQMSGDLWDQLEDETKEILMWHELLHVFPVMNEKSGEMDYRLRDHDVKDFYTIIQKHGIDWFGNLKTLFSSVYDIEPTKLDGFSL